MLRKPFDIEGNISDDGLNIDQGADVSIEEVIMDEQGADVLERTGEQRPRTRIVWFLMILAFAGVFGRLYYLTVTEHEYYRAIAQENRLRVEYVPAPRGAIHDRYGEVIASNKASFELVVNPLDIPQDDGERNQIIQEVASIIDMPVDEVGGIVERARDLSFQSVLVKQNIEREKALILHERAQSYPGFRIINTPIRDYKNPLVYAHLLGYVGKINAEEYEIQRDNGYLFNDTIGKAGIELLYEYTLRGEFAQRQVEVDARGVVQKVFGEKEAVPGNDIVLNIDAGLQQVLYDSLVARMDQLGKKRAAAIAMNPQNGEILSFISLPSFDNNLFAEGISQDIYTTLIEDENRPLFNRAIRGTYPPGSTVKPMVAAAALQEGIVDIDDEIDDRGYIVIENIFGGPDYFFYGFNRRALGPVAVREAIALSSDIFFYVVGGGYDPIQITGLGIEKLASYYKQFRIHEKLGIDLPGERSGLVPTPEWKESLYPDDPVNSRWYLGNTYHISIGQGDLLATPLHVLSWTATLANGGTIYKPQIVNRIETDEGEVIEKFDPESIGSLDIDPAYIKTVQEGMRMAVTDGTARTLSTLSVPVAGKTGSAQFDPRDPQRSHAWFVGYAPYDDPKLAIMILVEDGGLGANTSAPVAREAYQWWIENRYGNAESNQ